MPYVEHEVFLGRGLGHNRNSRDLHRGRRRVIVARLSSCRTRQFKNVLQGHQEVRGDRVFAVGDLHGDRVSPVGVGIVRVLVVFGRREGEYAAGAQRELVCVRATVRTLWNRPVQLVTRGIAVRCGQGRYCRGPLGNGERPNTGDLGRRSGLGECGDGQGQRGSQQDRRKDWLAVWCSVTTQCGQIGSARLSPIHWLDPHSLAQAGS